MNYMNRIIALREDEDLTQEDVAKVLHVAQTTYSDYERGVVRIPIEYLIRLAVFYDVDMNYICGLGSNKKIPHFPQKEGSFITINGKKIEIKRKRR